MPRKSSDAAGKKGTKKDEPAPKESKKSKKAARQAADADIIHLHPTPVKTKGCGLQGFGAPVVISHFIADLHP